MVYRRVARANMGHSSREWPMDRMAAMEAFVRVVDAGSFSGAAKQLRLGQPAVSKTIARLHVMPWLSAFLAEHPALDVDVLLSDANKNLIEEAIDVALRLGQLADSSFTARKIGQSQRRVIGSPAYFKTMSVPKTPADLAKHRAVVYDQPAGGTAWTFRRGTTEMSVILEGRVRVSAAEGVREGVFAGLGLAIASEWMFAPELKSGAVKVVLDDWLLPPHDLWAVFPGRQPSTKARVFANYIESQIAGTAPTARPKSTRATARLGASLAETR